MWIAWAQINLLPGLENNRRGTRCDNIEKSNAPNDCFAYTLLQLQAKRTLCRQVPLEAQLKVAEESTTLSPNEPRGEATITVPIDLER